MSFQIERLPQVPNILIIRSPTTTYTIVKLKKNENKESS